MSRAVWCFLAMAAAASAQDAAQDPNAKEVQAIFTSKVNLVMVPVVVRDKSGGAIGTLKREDFQLFDKGRPQVITRFLVEKASDRIKPIEIEKDSPADETKAAATAGVPPASFLAYLFDDYNIDFGDLAAVRNPVLKHLAESMRPDERVAVYTTSGRNMLDFTDDREKLRGAMMRIAPYSRTNREICPPMTYYEADRIINQEDQAVLIMAAQDMMVCANMNNTPVTRPNGTVTQADAESATNRARSVARRELELGNQEVRTTLGVLRDVARRMASSPGERTIVLISPGFYVNDDNHTAEMEVIDRAIRSNVMVSVIDPKGLTGGSPGPEIADAPWHTSNTPLQSNIREMVDQLDRAVSENVLMDLSAGTGGALFKNNNNIEESLREATQPPRFMYLLGFSPQNLKLDGKFHELRVSLNAKEGFTLVARRGYYAPRHSADEAALAQDEIREAVFSREELQEIPLELQTQYFKADDGTVKLRLVTKIDLKGLHFRKEQGLNKDTLTILAALFDHNGNIVTGAERKLTMNLKDATFEERISSGVSVTIPLSVPPGSYLVRIILRDQEGKLMTARNRALELPY